MGHVNRTIALAAAIVLVVVVGLQWLHHRALKQQIIHEHELIELHIATDVEVRLQEFEDRLVGELFQRR